jgi:hypothetical protein
LETFAVGDVPVDVDFALVALGLDGVVFLASAILILNLNLII